MRPVRIQRKRTKGWRMPEGAVYVGRPTVWGNPWLGGEALRRFRNFAPLAAERDAGWLVPLRGHDLACWCPLDHPCHADVLLELANR